MQNGQKSRQKVWRPQEAAHLTRLKFTTDAWPKNAQMGIDRKRKEMVLYRFEGIRGKMYGDLKTAVAAREGVIQNFCYNDFCRHYMGLCTGQKKIFFFEIFRDIAQKRRFRRFFKCKMDRKVGKKYGGRRRPHIWLGSNSPLMHDKKNAQEPVLRKRARLALYRFEGKIKKCMEI